MRACLKRTDFMQTSTIASLHSIEAIEIRGVSRRSDCPAAGQSLRRLTPLTLWLKWGEDVCAPAVCGAGVWYAVGRYNIRESIIGNLFVIYLVF